VGVVVIGGALATVLVGDAFLGATAAARNDREHDTDERAGQTDSRKQAVTKSVTVRL
jgi:hypothetical protein